MVHKFAKSLEANSVYFGGDEFLFISSKVDFNIYGYFLSMMQSSSAMFKINFQSFLPIKIVGFYDNYLMISSYDRGSVKSLKIGNPRLELY